MLWSPPAIASVPRRAGVDALREFVRRSPHVVLLSAEMPVIDAPQMARLLRAAEDPDCRTAIIAIGDAGTLDAAQLQAAGVNVVLPKPLDLQALSGLLCDLWHLSAGPHVRRAWGASYEPQVVNVRGSLDRLGGDQNLLLDLIGFFFEDAFPLLDRIHQSLVRQEWEPARRAAHSLKGLAANFGAAPAVAALFAVETMPDATPEEGVRLGQEVDRTLARLTAALADFADANPRAT